MLRFDAIWYCSHKTMYSSWGQKAKCKNCPQTFYKWSDAFKNAVVIQEWQYVNG